MAWLGDLSGSGCLLEVEVPACPGEVPDLLGDAMHIDGKADAAVADQRQPEFLLSHDGKMARAVALVDPIARE